MADETNLLPCPFCGGRPQWLPEDRLASERHNIGCLNHDCFGPATTAVDDDAIVQWNKRAEPITSSSTGDSKPCQTGSR